MTVISIKWTQNEDIVWIFSHALFSRHKFITISLFTRQTHEWTLNVKHAIIRTWKKYLLLDVSSTSNDTLVPSLYQCVEARSTEILRLSSQPLPYLLGGRASSATFENPSKNFSTQLWATRGPLSLVRMTEELLEWKSSGSGSRKSRLTAVGIRCSDYATPSIRKSCHYADMRRSLGRYNSLTD
jgi:hypothetical protein